MAEKNNGIDYSEAGIECAICGQPNKRCQYLHGKLICINCFKRQKIGVT